MTFTSTPPTEPGAYAYRYINDLSNHVSARFLTQETIDTYPKELLGKEWCRLVPLDEYVEKGEVEKLRNVLFSIQLEHLHSVMEAKETGNSEGLWLKPSLYLDVDKALSHAKALLDGKEQKI